MRFLVSIAGGFALLFILFGAFTITTAAGNPEKLESGKTIIISAIAGLIFLILSVVILHFVGVDLLQIPGLGS